MLFSRSQINCLARGGVLAGAALFKINAGTFLLPNFVFIFKDATG